MASPDTRTQILDAAEVIFAERGFSGASVRAITDLAGVNLAAVGYHFGSKRDLIAAVARRVIEPINVAQNVGLDRLLEQAPEPQVADLVSAFVGPLFDEIPADDIGGSRKSLLIMTIITDPAKEMRNWMGSTEAAVRDRYRTAFMRALPNISSAELEFRMRGLLAVVAVDRIEMNNRGTLDSSDELSGVSTRRWAMAFLVAAMKAPSQ
ncbi:TetR/AcrR family transcriptional regulator [Arthrobacter cryoconiti]|uniref:TetR/AcrR family transcriptional regulator n=1 Tax=Arthrobacter cryoconiti TaxID=748907 RepID=A0ABV8QY23_9MICC|nr:TetR/AcrR family transcriptional regulator [Arthrobacter cryoconiti]MCC9069531.1 TetR family transcriptional regulator [Arthrobacter cryoconiti]